jgi:hypothetical protein
MWALANLVAVLLLTYLVYAGYKKRASVRRYRDALLAASDEQDRV